MSAAPVLFSVFFFFFFFVNIPGRLVLPLVWNLLRKSKLGFDSWERVIGMDETIPSDR